MVEKHVVYFDLRLLVIVVERVINFELKKTLAVGLGGIDAVADHFDWIEIAQMTEVAVFAREKVLVLLQVVDRQ
jgi:hypothetical protein